jgi:hypothetical protein
MRQFIPFEDDWDAFESLCSGTLIPYRVGLVCANEPALDTQIAGSLSPLAFSAPPVRVSGGATLPVDSPST